MAKTIPVSAVVPTRDRADVLLRTLRSLRAQSALPAEAVIVDASADATTKQAIDAVVAELASCGCRLIWQAAKTHGAAAQRNEGVATASESHIWFIDDDIIFEPNCVIRLWTALQSDARLGGVNAMITNQRYHRPGRVSHLMFRLMGGRFADSYAGRVIGPAINLLPEDRDDLPDIVPVEWLNTTCTLYRRAALPDPAFSDQFSGYSLMEDLTLSLVVGRQWKLANARTARIHHDSQPGAHKDDLVALSRMELVNRHYVMVEILRRRRVRDYAKLILWEGFQLGACVIQRRGSREFWRTLWGKILGLGDILGGRSILVLRR